MAYINAAIANGSCQTGTNFSVVLSNNNNSYGYNDKAAMAQSKGIQVVCGTWNSSLYYGYTLQFIGNKQVPHDAIPNSLSADLVISVPIFNLKTFAYYSTETKVIKISVPTSVQPSISSYTISKVNSGLSTAADNWGLFVQGYTKAAINIRCDAGDGAKISQIGISTSKFAGSGTTTIIYPQNVSSYSGSWTTEKLICSEALTFKVTVTDSRSRTYSLERTITIYPYEKPKISSVEAYRVANNSSTIQDDNGKYVYVKASLSCSSVNGNNSLTTKNAVLVFDQNQYTGSFVGSGSVETIYLGQNDISPEYVATLTLTAVDIVGQRTVYEVQISSIEYALHVRSGGKSLGIARSAGTTDDKIIHVGWPIEMDSGKSIKINGSGSAFEAAGVDSNNHVQTIKLMSGTGIDKKGLYDLENNRWVIYASDAITTTIDNNLKVAYINATRVECNLYSVSSKCSIACDLGSGNIGPRIRFNEFPNDYDTSNLSEAYVLPRASNGLTTFTIYDILTSKNPVTIAQGGTGASTGDGACTAIGAVKKSGDTMSGNLIIGDTSDTVQRSVTLRSGSGRIFLYANGSPTGNKGIFVSNASDTGKDLITVDQNNKINSLAEVNCTINMGQSGASSSSGGKLQWKTADGTEFTIRPYNNLFQLIRTPSGGSASNVLGFYQDGSVSMANAPKWLSALGVLYRKQFITTNTNGNADVDLDRTRYAVISAWAPGKSCIVSPYCLASGHWRVHVTDQDGTTKIVNETMNVYIVYMDFGTNAFDYNQYSDTPNT